MPALRHLFYSIGRKTEGRHYATVLRLCSSCELLHSSRELLYSNCALLTSSRQLLQSSPLLLISSSQLLVSNAALLVSRSSILRVLLVQSQTRLRGLYSDVRNRKISQALPGCHE